HSLGNRAQDFPQPECLNRATCGAKRGRSHANACCRFLVGSDVDVCHDCERARRRMARSAIDASSDSRLTESVQQMRDVLPYNRAVLFVLTLKDLKTRFSPAEYREHLNGLTYKQIVQLGSPNVGNEYLAYYSRLREKDL